MSFGIEEFYHSIKHHCYGAYFSPLIFFIVELEMLFSLANRAFDKLGGTVGFLFACLKLLDSDLL